MPDPKIDTSALDDTLKALLKAAESTALSKGGIENSGTHGSGGKQGGGQGSEEDAGPVDHMMIAKMIQAGVDVQYAAKFAAFMSMEAKEGDDDDDDDDAYKSASADAAKVAGGQLAKSFRDHLSENLTPEDNEMVNVTPYLDGLTQTVGERLESLGKAYEAGRTEQGTTNRMHAAALHQMGTLLKSQERVISELGRKLGIVEKSPAAPPKGVTGTAQPLDKSMAGEAGGGEEQLTKSSTLSTLSYMNLVKSEKMIAGQVTSDVICKLESANIFDANSHAAVQHFLKGLTPTERQEALNF